MRRITALDQLRGIAIINMLLGHSVATFTGLYRPELWYLQAPTDLALGPALVRLFNHTGTPAFFLVMGISMALFAQSRRAKGWSDTQVKSYFLARGVLLIVLQFTIINAGWSITEGSLAWADVSFSTLFDPRGRWLYFGVLFALGGSMIICAFLIDASTKALLALAALIIAAPLVYLDFVTISDGVITESFILGPLAVPGRWPEAWVLYTVIPWLGPTILGVLVGRWIFGNIDKATRYAAIAGAICVCVAITLQVTLWLLAEAEGMLSIIWLVRYPPGIALLCFSFGVNALLFALLQSLRSDVLSGALTLFGRSALPLYVVHLFVLGVLAEIWGRDVDLPMAAAIAFLALFLLAPFCWAHQKQLPKAIRWVSGSKTHSP